MFYFLCEIIFPASLILLMLRMAYFRANLSWSNHS